MDISIQGFRNHTDSQYRIESGGITLIQGPSGVGKSTILKAIQWVLYGSIRKVHDNTGRMKKCNVTLSIDDLFVVYRQKKPDLFKITMNEQTYEDDVAQEIINRHFGSEMYWNSASFLCSGESCLLLDASQKDKMKILNEIALTDDDPERYKTKVQEHIDIQKRVFDSKKALFEQADKELTAYLNTNPIEPDNVCKTEEEAMKNINIAKEKYKKRSDELDESRERRNRFKYISERIIQMKTLREKMGSLENIDDLKIRLQVIQDNIEKQTIREQYQPDIDQLTKDMSSFSLSKKDMMRTVNEDEMLTLRDQVSKYTKGMDTCHLYKIEYTIKAIQKRKNELTKLIQAQPMLKIRQEARERILAIDEQLEELAEGDEWDKDDIECLKEEWRNYNKTREICKKYTLPHRKKSIQERIDYLDKIIKNQPKAKEYQRYLKLKESAANLYQKEITQHDVMTTYNQLNDAKMLANKQSYCCPKCSTDLFMVNDSLVIAGKQKAPTKITLDKLQNNYDLIVKKFNEYQQYCIVQASLREIKVTNDETEVIDNIEPYTQELYDLTNIVYQSKPGQTVEDVDELTQRARLEKERKSIMQTAKLTEDDLEKEDKPMDVSMLEKELQCLQNVEIVKKPNEDLDHLQSIKKYHEKKERLEDFTKKVNKLPTIDKSLSELKKEHKATEILLNQIIQKNQQITSMDETLKSYETELAGIIIPRDTKDDLAVYQEQIEKAMVAYEHTKRSVYILGRKDYINSLNAELQEVHEKLISLKQLKEICEKIECETLQSTLDSMNETLSQVTDAMFDDPISISLQLFKPLKSKDITKTSVNLLIRLKGGEYDSISELSSGERNRVNLAMTIAMARISPIPFVMLDECLSSLNADLRERCVQVIQTMLANKTVIDIEHFVVEGMFNNVIRIDG